MSKVRFVGLDVHRDSITVAVADTDGSAPDVICRIPNDPPRLLKKLQSLAHAGATLKCCFEAGPTGVTLQRQLARAGIECIVVAPSKVPDAPGSRVKTDGRDAIRLARFLRSGDLMPLHISDEATEAMKDLSRAREDALEAKQRARQQLSGFLLRHGRAYAGKKQGTKAHLEWARKQQFDTEAQKRVLADYVDSYQAAIDREKKLVADIEALVESWQQAPLVRALCALRGVQTITAVTVVAEIGDFGRFEKAPSFASYLGLTPSESSSGDSQRQGGITKAGNSHVRRVLVEAAWNYRFRSLSENIRRRGEATLPEARAIAQKAQERLYRRYFALTSRGKDKNKIAVAIARELACFIWAIARDPALANEMEKHRMQLKAQRGKKAA